MWWVVGLVFRWIWLLLIVADLVLCDFIVVCGEFGVVICEFTCLWGLGLGSLVVLV